MMSKRIAIIDLGSNSGRLIIFHICQNSAYNLIYEQKETLRLGESIAKTGKLSGEALTRTLGTFHTFAHMCKLFKVDTILAVATAAVRNADNGDKFLRSVLQETGIEVKVISGIEEAHLGYLGTINTIDIDNAVLFDLGGGSIELTYVKDRTALHSISIPLGAVTLTEEFKSQNKLSIEELNTLIQFITKKLAAVPWLHNCAVPLVGIGGTARNIAKMDQRKKNYPFNKVHNYRLGYLSFKKLWNDIISSSYAQRRKIPGLNSERADIILAGSTLIHCLFEITQADRLIVSGNGVRTGLFYEHYAPDKAPDILHQSARNLLLLEESNTAHAEHVRKLALSLFDGWENLHQLSKRDRTILDVAALLHDIGIRINYYNHPRHSAYLVENASLFGLTHHEQILTAVIVGWHNGLNKKFAHNAIYNELLDATDWIIARKLSLLLALAETLDATEMGLIEKVQAGIHKNGAPILQIHATEPAPIEQQALAQHEKWFKKEFGLPLTVVDVTSPR